MTIEILDNGNAKIVDGPSITIIHKENIPCYDNGKIKCHGTGFIPDPKFGGIDLEGEPEPEKYCGECLGEEA